MSIHGLREANGFDFFFFVFGLQFFLNLMIADFVSQIEGVRTFFSVKVPYFNAFYES